MASVARQILRKAALNGSIRASEVHSKQPLYTPTAQIVEKAAETTGKDVKKGGKGKKWCFYNWFVPKMLSSINIIFSFKK